MKLGILWHGLLLLSVFCCQSAHCQDWKELLDRADSLSDSSKYDSAIILGQLALQITEELFGSEDTAIARVLNGLGEYHRMKGNYSVAESLFERSLAICENTYGPEHLESAKPLHYLAMVCRKQTRFSEAEAFILRSLSIRERHLGSNHLTVAWTLNTLAIIYKRLGKYADAEPLARRVLKIREEQLAPDNPAVARALNNLASLYLYMGRWSTAEPLLRRALSIKERILGPRHIGLAATLYNLHYLYDKQGNLAASEIYLQQALAIVEAVHGPNHPDVARCLNALGALRSSQLRFVDAERLLAKAFAINERVLGPEDNEVASNLCNLGEVRLKLGELADAERLYEKALAIRKTAFGDNHPTVASTLRSLAHIFSELGRYSDAEDYLNTSLEITERVCGPIHPSVAKGLSDLSDLYTVTERYAEAEEHYLRALGLGERIFGKQSQMLAHDLRQLSKLYRLQSRTAEAIETAGRAYKYQLAAFRKNCSVLSERDALEYSRCTRATLDQYMSCLADLKLGNATHIRDATDAVLASKGLVTEEILERQRNAVVETDSLVLALAESLRHTKYQLSNLYVDSGNDDVDEYRRKLDSLETSANDLESNLSIHSASYRKQQSFQDVSADRISSLLPDGIALIEYYCYDNLQVETDRAMPQYLAVVLTNDNDPVLVDLGDATEIEQLVNVYRKHMAYVSTAGLVATATDFEEYARISRRLHQLIWQPIEEFVVDKELALIAPDGALNTVSFAGLIGSDGTYLVENSAVHYLSAGRDLVRYAETSETGSGLFALGNPDYDASVSDRLRERPIQEQSDILFVHSALRNARSGCGKLSDFDLSPLPDTYVEIQEVTATWKGTTDEPAIICLGGNATEDMFKAEAPGKRVVHLATHGYFLGSECVSDMTEDRHESELRWTGENPLLHSGLFFAGANLHGQGADSAGLDDGILTAYEVSAMDLRGAELVVLSACETGLGKIHSGEGVYGLRRAFQMAGAETVISTLWSVPDQMTAEISSQLYDRRGVSLAETIRRVQLERIDILRQQGKVDHPISWGALAAYGNWR